MRCPPSGAKPGQPPIRPICADSMELAVESLNRNAAEQKRKRPMLTMPPEKTTEATWLQEILTSAVPLGQAMALEVSRLDEHGVELKLPLAPNVNDKGTAFGGALASAMILAAWSIPRVLLARHKISADL